MPALQDLPPEVFLDNLLPFLPVTDLQHLGATSKDFYKLTSDDLFWKRKIREDYNFPDSSTARNTGWKFIYKRLANPKVYVWGDHSQRRLALNPRDLPNNVYGGVPHPMRLRIPGARIVSLVAGGMSFHAIDALGKIYVWGVLNGLDWALNTDGFSEPAKIAQTPMRLDLSCAMRSISCARLYSAGLDSESNVWTFTSWGRPFRLVTPLLDKSSVDSTPVRVECGWSYTSILTGGGIVYVYWPRTGGMQQELHRLNDEMDRKGNLTKAKVSDEHTDVIPCHAWDLTTYEPHRLPPIPTNLPHLTRTALPPSQVDEETKLVQIAGLDNNLIGLTNKGHVLRYNKLSGEDSYESGHWEYLPYFSEVEKVAELPAFSNGPLELPSTLHVTHISAHFRTFVVYTSGPESVVLLKQIETEDFGAPGPALLGNAPLKPEVPLSLQYRSVISVVLGDYHYGALTSDGTLLSWGAFSKGALGLGDPVDIEPGQPGGFNTREERLAVMDARAHMPFTPPDVREPTAVRFDHMLKSKGRKKFVFAATAAGWHSGALVIDLEPDEEDEEDVKQTASSPPEPTHHTWQGPPIIPIAGAHFPFRIGLAGRGPRPGRGGVGRGHDQ
ncbi:hypothetical protein PHLGIDRAFT_28732 [Phlebiopsis gigantea 11061_1 CR5-6]|uniref:F-box domain-containing protein n=1 Tax=Phlebiopsis gigantea (strain 11061_1 CR5-6) TaxID=745531 RepID=A0A0C3SDY8_PHLG1|nr:hypothetical protein PHLGIDRAFT_28732 [Phlebiopsis gigantea 11061_1 CR5-6]